MVAPAVFVKNSRRFMQSVQGIRAPVRNRGQSELYDGRLPLRRGFVLAVQLVEIHGDIRAVLAYGEAIHAPRRPSRIRDVLAIEVERRVMLVAVEALVM